MMLLLHLFQLLAASVRGLGNVMDQVQNTWSSHVVMLEALRNDVN